MDWNALIKGSCEWDCLWYPHVWTYKAENLNLQWCVLSGLAQWPDESHCFDRRNLRQGNRSNMRSLHDASLGSLNGTNWRTCGMARWEAQLSCWLAIRGTARKFEELMSKRHVDSQSDPSRAAHWSVALSFSLVIRGAAHKSLGLWTAPSKLCRLQAPVGGCQSAFWSMHPVVAAKCRSKHHPVGCSFTKRSQTALHCCGTELSTLQLCTCCSLSRLSGCQRPALDQ